MIEAHESVYPTDGLEIYQPDIEGIREPLPLTNPELAGRLMQYAFNEGMAGPLYGDLPIGAAVSIGPELLAIAYPTDQATGDPTQHAERRAIEKLKSQFANPEYADNLLRNPDCVLTVSFECCQSCFDYVLETGIPQIVFASYRDKVNEQAVTPLFNPRPGIIERAKTEKLPVTITGGFLEDEGTALFGELQRDLSSGVIKLPVGYSIARKELRHKLPINVLDVEPPELSPIISNGKK